MICCLNRPTCRHKRMMKRNSVEIRVWLKRNGFKLATIQKDLGYRDNKTVWSTIEGQENNRKVLTWLMENGCPTKYLALPDDLRRAA